nr:immunoglobulin heavy chain junction region [Macaca mulatta]MOW80409.1 immunoglobulin heavy chain junction region [Macaca mulatta]MOW86003.1 immunoglobulin heavy chain junction region [Macaca mulatta]
CTKGGVSASLDYW